MQLVFAGDSHVTALGVPVRFPDNENKACPVLDLPGEVKVFTGEWPRSGKYWDDLIQISPSHVVILWKGNQAAARYMICDGSPFDFILHGQDKLEFDTSCRIVPEAVLEAQMSLGIQSLGAIVTRLRTVGIHPIIAQPPAPKGNSDHLRQAIFREPVFRKMAAELGMNESNIRFVSKWTRLKLWLLLSRVYRETAEALSVPFLPVPKKSLDDEGFLRRDLYAPDATHASGDYARLLVPSAFELAETNR